MTYNQGVHGAQDTANAMVRAGVTFDVVTEDWQSEAFRARIGRWARAAAAVTAWKRLKVAQVGFKAAPDVADGAADFRLLRQPFWNQHLARLDLADQRRQAAGPGGADAEFARRDVDPGQRMPVAAVARGGFRQRRQIVVAAGIEEPDR